MAQVAHAEAATSAASHVKVGKHLLEMRGDSYVTDAFEATNADVLRA